MAARKKTTRRRGPRGNAGSRANQVAQAATQIQQGRGGRTYLPGGPKNPSTTGAGAGATGQVPGPTAPPPGPEEEGPPPYAPPDGYEWVLDPETGEWSIEAIEGEDEDEEDNDAVTALIMDALSQFGLDTPGLISFANNLIANGMTSVTEVLMELRKHPDYLADPVRRANIERAKQGKGFMAEGVLISWAGSIRSLARRYGFAEPPDNYIANALLASDDPTASAAEWEHRFAVQKNINELGGGVRWVAENLLGVNLSDNDLYEIFDPEIDTAEFDRAYTDALYRGRPMALGLGVRSQAEADAFRALGVDPEEAYKRYEGVAANASKFARLASIEDLITQGLPDDWNPDFSTDENSHLIRAGLFHNAESQQVVDDAIARELARFKQGGGSAKSSSGQAVGLLSSSERQTYG